MALNFRPWKLGGFTSHDDSATLDWLRVYGLRFTGSDVLGLVRLGFIHE